MAEGKKPHKNKPTSKKYSKYKIEGDKIVSKAKSCPRCGPGVFLMEAKDRSYCGRCHYTEFLSKKEVAVEAKPAEEVASAEVPSGEGKEVTPTAEVKEEKAE